MLPLFAAIETDALVQYLINGLSYGMLIALVALGYTMVYGIVELINFAHGDLFMLGGFLGWTIVAVAFDATAAGSTTSTALALFVCFVVVPCFCGLLNLGVDRVIYKPLRKAPKLAPLVSAIGVSFIFQNLGLFWGGPQDVDFPKLIPNTNLLGEKATIRFTYQDLLVVGVTIPLMIALTVFVRFTSLGKAMRATAQNPTAAQLMGINTERVIATTFLIGGALAGFGAMIYGLSINSINYQMGFLVGLYAFTAAVLGGIGNIPGAVLGGLLIGLVRSLGSAYVGERWTGALVFTTLIVVLVFRPAGLLGSRVREKV